MVVCQAQVVANLEQGSSRRWAIIATTRSRSRQGLAEMMVAKPRLRMIPRTAWTWPWGEGLLGGEELLGGD